ncbi:MAG: hypothetical protein JO222_11500, partial [Frankiales bacterium]|nr:hypothetical protein [Frankiales bacterium]
VVALAEERVRARAARDFAAADGLREAIADRGWLVTDEPNGFRLAPKPPYDVLGSVRELPDNSAEPADRRATVSVVVDGWPDDVRRCLDALAEHAPDDVTIQALDLGNVDAAGDALHEVATEAGGRIEEWHVGQPPLWRDPAAGGAGWSAARLALLRADTAHIHVWCDLSTVLTGDAISPLLDAIDADDSVVGAGWRGVDVDLADEWRSFSPAGPGEVDAVLGYLFAMRRDAALAVGGPHAKARFYRNADMEFSFALREATGGRLVVPAAELPCEHGRHHGYHDTDPSYRDAESARTYQRFLQRYRGRKDLLHPR